MNFNGEFKTVLINSNKVENQMNDKKDWLSMRKKEFKERGMNIENFDDFVFVNVNYIVKEISKLEKKPQGVVSLLQDDCHFLKEVVDFETAYADYEKSMGGTQKVEPEDEYYVPFQKEESVGKNMCIYSEKFVFFLKFIKV